jgi:DNA-binding MarR family transcriptional regulator
MRFVPEDGIPVGELGLAAHLSPKSAQMILKRLSEWWGYLVVGPDPAGTRAKPPPSARLVLPTAAGRQAQNLWALLTSVVEDRWRARFGGKEVERLIASLVDIISHFDIEFPPYLPVGEPSFEPRRAGQRDEEANLTLPSLMSKVLMAFALDFKSRSDLSLGIYTSRSVSRLEVCANILRALDDDGIHVADVPALTGVAKMTTDNWLSSLEKHRYALVGPEGQSSRYRVVHLTPEGRKARDAYRLWAATVEQRWKDRFGARTLGLLRGSAEQLASGTGPQSRLWRGIEPYPDGWRAHLPRPETLPHFPVISARGGFPDGS